MVRYSISPSAPGARVYKLFPTYAAYRWVSDSHRRPRRAETVARPQYRRTLYCCAVHFFFHWLAIGSFAFPFKRKILRPLIDSPSPAPFRVHIQKIAIAREKKVIPHAKTSVAPRSRLAHARASVRRGARGESPKIYTYFHTGIKSIDNKIGPKDFAFFFLHFFLSASLGRAGRSRCRCTGASTSKTRVAQMN